MNIIIPMNTIIHMNIIIPMNIMIHVNRMIMIHMNRKMNIYESLSKCVCMLMHVLENDSCTSERQKKQLT